MRLLRTSSQKSCSAVERREIARDLVTGHGLLIQRVYQVVGLGWTTYYPATGGLCPAQCAGDHHADSRGRGTPALGLVECYARGCGWMARRGITSACGGCIAVGGSISPVEMKTRLPARLRQPLESIPQHNVVWAIDFMSDTLYGGRRFRTLNVLDEGV